MGFSRTTGQQQISKWIEIILYFGRHPVEPNVLVVPYAVTQDGIAAAIGISRPHVAVELTRLEGRGLVARRLAHVPERAGKRLGAYFLTPHGWEYRTKLEKGEVAILKPTPEERDVYTALQKDIYNLSVEQAQGLRELIGGFSVRRIEG